MSGAGVEFFEVGCDFGVGGPEIAGEEVGAFGFGVEVVSGEEISGGDGVVGVAAPGGVRRGGFGIGEDVLREFPPVVEGLGGTL